MKSLPLFYGSDLEVLKVVPNVDEQGSSSVKSIPPFPRILSHCTFKTMNFMEGKTSMTEFF